MAQVGFGVGAPSMLSWLCFMLLVALAASQDQPATEENRVELPNSDSGVQKALVLAVESFNTQSSGEFYYKALQLLKAEKQVGDGIKYFLNVDMVKTTCQKEMGYDLPHAELEKCSVTAEAKKLKYNCEFEVWFNEKKSDAGIQTWRRLSWRCTSRFPILSSK